jgi:hypothetical protein
MKASNNLKLIMLSSTINTLIGGTEVSSAKGDGTAKTAAAAVAFFDFDRRDFVEGRGEETRGGGVPVRMGKPEIEDGAGGVGSGFRMGGRAAAEVCIMGRAPEVASI